jgi:serine protease AprX
MRRSAKLRRVGAAIVASAAALAGAAVAVTAGPAEAAVTSSSGKWLWEGTATTVGNVKDGVDWERSVSPTGKGVSIALIDTGVAPVTGLTTGNVVYGPDLSLDSQDPARRYTDGFGHGTHLAGLISSKSPDLTGLAPGAKLLSVKVGASTGAVDVSQVLAAIDWTVAHKNDDPANPVRVMVLAYGTDGVQKYDIDPLCAAVENAWRAGITVVVSGGNNGNSARLQTPATDKYVLSVGAMDQNGTTTWADDKVASFTSLGDTTRKVDLLAPGRSLVSLRAPGSSIDLNYPAARIGTGYFLGSGSSQAAAVTGAVIADLLELFPTLSPDQVKKILTQSAVSVVGTSIGLIDLHWAYTDYRRSPGDYSVSRSAQSYPKSTGKGLLEASRGTAHLSDGTVQLTGENDMFGAFSTVNWAAASANKTAWNGGSWMGRIWTGQRWETAGNGPTTWAGRAWSGSAWSGRAWSGRAWSGASWQSIKSQAGGW